MDCKYCTGRLIRKGFQKNGKQKYQCKSCRLFQQSEYIYAAYRKHTNRDLVHYLNSGCTLRRLALGLKISRTTLASRILELAENLKYNKPLKSGLDYEVDELRTFCGSKEKECWLIYIIEKQTRDVIALRVGSRSHYNLSKVLNEVIRATPARIFSDGLPAYKQLIPQNIHQVSKNKINYIERKNLTLRTHLKCLGRRSICFARKKQMLEARAKIYLFMA